MGKGGLVAVAGEPDESQLVGNAAREALLLMNVLRVAAKAEAAFTRTPGLASNCNGWVC